MSQYTGSVVNYTARALLAWYVSLILLGTAGLMLPLSQPAGRDRLRSIDALFTATSATCVTGLTVCSTGHDLTPFGQAVVLLLIQLGGIGITTVTTFLTFQIRGGGGGLRQRRVVTETLGADERVDLGTVLRSVLVFTLLIEAAGAGILLVDHLLQQGMPTAAALWQAVFHSISAFCNAGFALRDDSLVAYQADVVMNLTVAALIIVGGIGFPVVLDLRRRLPGPKRELWGRLNLHTKLMLVGTAALLAGGTLAILLLEWDESLAAMGWGEKVLVSFFQSVVPRTAGFNSVDIGTLTNATLFIIVLLMIVGAGPCSTGGGFKVSTLMVLVLRSWATFRGRRQTQFARRTIPAELVDRATMIAFLFGVVAALGLTYLLVFEQSKSGTLDRQDPFLAALFEVVSALGTVGLSLGLTGELSDPGKLIIILLMLIGRLGPISVIVALSRSQRAAQLEFAEERPLIG